MDIEQLEKSFIKRFGKSNEKIQFYFAPGRVNLIGEHTDYNNGYVLPCAITFGTYLLVRANDSNVVKMVSENFDYGDEIPIDKLSIPQSGKWMNYPLGVFDQFIQKGLKPSGLEMLYSGDIPNSSGLSSSASIEMVTAFALNDLFYIGLEQTDLVKLSQKAENEFVGVNCGIMDQFAVGMGKKGHAIFLDCGTLEYELVPIDLKNYKIIIANTNKQRGLADSKYNERVAECNKAVGFLAKIKKVESLSDFSYQEFVNNKHHIPDINIRKRAKHILSENQRVVDAVKVLKNDDLRVFGKLMNASHNSLRYDYEVTGYELDTIVEEARKVEGVLGSRMTGAGFGGCAIALVDENAVEPFIRKVGENYYKKTGLKAIFYISEIGDGTKKLNSSEN
ncbi:MAG: galactokinase [Bacteroidales bacterium]|nr:galactokinase [Bacteroidales bacterium]